MMPINRLNFLPKLDDLLTATNIDHLLPEADRLLAQQACDEFAVLGRQMDREQRRRALYPVYYESACELIAAGLSHDEIRAELEMLWDTDDAQLLPNCGIRPSSAKLGARIDR
jgi:hypothetical protein